MTYLFILLCFLYFNDINIVEKIKIYKKNSGRLSFLQELEKSWPDIACPVKATLMRK